MFLLGPAPSVFCANPTYLLGWGKNPSSHFKSEELAFPGCKRQLLQFQLKELLGLGRQRPTSEISFSGIYEDQVISLSFSFFSNWLLLMLWKHCAVFVWRMEKYGGWWNEPDWPYSWGNMYVCLLSFAAAYNGILRICMSFKLTSVIFKGNFIQGITLISEPRQLFLHLLL